MNTKELKAISDRERFEIAYEETSRPCIKRPYPQNKDGGYTYSEINEAWSLWQIAANSTEFNKLDVRNLELEAQVWDVLFNIEQNPKYTLVDAAKSLLVVMPQENYMMPEQQRLSFQQRVQPWLLECFGEMIAGDREERNHRFLEEALELVQATGCTASEAHQLVDYVFGRPVGEPSQEVGGVMVTLAALCLANKLDMHQDGETELTRINQPEVVLKIRAKQAAKPKCSPLPEAKMNLDAFNNPDQNTQWKFPGEQA